MSKQVQGAKSAIVIGASMGGLNALKKILSKLPGDLAAAAIIVQHQKSGRENLLVYLLAQASHLPVLDAVDKALVRGGNVYVAPANYHLQVEYDRHLSLSIDPHVAYARPSIDVLFESAAEVYRSNLVGVLLTGANHDGTHGLARVIACGGVTIVQDPNEAEARTMPRSAIEAGVAHHILTLEQISDLLIELTNTQEVDSDPA
jgi:two-component system chemotaxis response regulator CheB